MIKERPQPITRQENWDDYNCFLLERILDELIKLNKNLVKSEKGATRKSTRGDTK